MKPKLEMTKEPIPDYGELFTIEEFKEYCDDGSFIDYDETGRYSDGKFIYGDPWNDTANPSDFVKGNINMEFTHVMWFNR